MKQWLRRIRGAVGTGVTWAVAWALTGPLIGLSSILLPWLPWDAFFEVFDAPLPALGLPGFVAGTLFSVVLGIAGRRRRFDELSLPRFAAWGAVGGFVLGMFPVVWFSIAGGEATLPRLLQLAAVWTVPVTLLSAMSATGSLMLARKADDRELLAASREVDAVGLSQRERRELLEGPG